MSQADTQVLVLGADGLLGRSVYRELAKSDSVQVTGTSRGASSTLTAFQFAPLRLEQLIAKHEPDFVVNCIGQIPQRIKQRQVSEDAYRVNWELPLALSRVLAGGECRVIQIATDCAYTGAFGPYDEASPRNATDDYGSSKVRGEVQDDRFVHVRSSIVGLADGDRSSLAGWLANQPVGGTIQGLTNHFWNGVTTDAFGQVVQGLISSQDWRDLAGQTVHLVPSDFVSKYELLLLLKDRLGRDDITVEPHASDASVDRRLTTRVPEVNRRLWGLAGFDTVPTVADLIRAMIQTSPP